MGEQALGLLDDGVGEVLAALREQDLLESTLVVFLGDNGGNNECIEDNNASDASDQGCDGVPT